MSERGPGLAPSLSSDAVRLAELAEGAPYGDAVQRLLAVVRTQLGMQVAWVSEFVEGEQVLRYVDADPGADAPSSGTRLPLGGSFCARVLDGRFPALIPDARQVPEAALLDVTAQLHIGAYVGVPLISPSGVVDGMLCAIHDSAMPDLSDRDVAALQLLASLLHDLQRRAVSAAEATAERDRLRSSMADVVSGQGRQAVFQPIIDLRSGRVVAAEGLTRFTSGARLPAQWFDDASRLGMRAQLEMAAARAVLDRLPAVPPWVAVSINLGPDCLLSDELAGLLEGRPLDRVVVELTEHQPVQDYAALATALQPYRDAGLRLAVDDAGAGYASLRHVLAVRPDFVKVDMALTRGADTDVARRTLLTALAAFTTALGGRLVCEGVETDAELAAVRECGVHLVQGYLLGRPAVDPAWSL